MTSEILTYIFQFEFKMYYIKIRRCVHIISDVIFLIQLPTRRRQSGGKKESALFS